MDAKGRIAVPARFREELEKAGIKQLMVTIGADSPCLVAYPMPEWERVERAVNSLPSLQTGVKHFQRMFIGHATEYEIDNSGRILLTPALRKRAELEKKLVLIGQSTKFEIWGEDAWEATSSLPVMPQDDGQPLSEAFQSLNL